MPLRIVRNDLTKMRVDAIVNAANESLLGGGGVDGCIHRAAGPELLAECRALGGCAVGQAKLTGGYRLPCRCIVHTVGPRWRGGAAGEARQLAACYRNALELAEAHGCESVAFPLISSGAYGYPKDQALHVAVGAIGAFLDAHEMTVFLVIYDRESSGIGTALYSDIAAYISDNYVERYADDAAERLRRGNPPPDAWRLDTVSFSLPPMEEAAASPAAPAAPEKKKPRALFGARRRSGERAETPRAPREGAPDRPAPVFTAPQLAAPAPPYAPRAQSLDEALARLDESFSEMLLRKIDEAGMTDAQCYKKANIDRKLFSKIRSDKQYRPSKPTALAFAIALELPLSEARELLEKAGFALSRSSKFDIIVEYFIQRGNYNVFEINEALFAFDQSLLG